MCFVKKCCYCIPIRWGMIIVGIIDLLIAVGIAVALTYILNLNVVFISIACLFLALHVISCILLLVSVCVTKNYLVMPFLVTTVIRMVELLIWMGWGFKEGHNIFSASLLAIIAVRIYFWICVFSWYRELYDPSRDSQYT